MPIDLNAPGVPISFEVYPPRSDAGFAALYETIRHLAAVDPRFISVTYGAGGSTGGRSLELLTHIRRERGAWARRAYAVGFFDAVRTKLLDKRNIQTINVEKPTNELDSGIDSFMAELNRRAGVP